MVALAAPHGGFSQILAAPIRMEDAMVTETKNIGLTPGTEEWLVQAAAEATRDRIATAVALKKQQQVVDEAQKKVGALKAELAGLAETEKKAEERLFRFYETGTGR